MKLDAADLAFLDYLVEKAIETFFPPTSPALAMRDRDAPTKNLHRARPVRTLEGAMSEAHAIKSEPLTELMTWAHIRERYPDQWVALVEMDWDDEVDEFTVARVAGHGTTRRAPFDQMRAAGLNYETVGHFYTGSVRAHAIDFVR